MFEELANAALPSAPDVVRSKAAARGHLRPHRGEVVRVPLLVRIRKHEVESPLERRDDLVRVAQTCLHVRSEAGFPEVHQRLAMPSWIDFDGDEPAAGFAQGPSDPDARVAGRRANLEGPREPALQNQVVEETAVGLRHIEIPPGTAVLIEEGANLHVQRTRAGALRVRCLAAAEVDRGDSEEQHSNQCPAHTSEYDESLPGE